MADSTSNTVYNIFKSMEFGPSASSNAGTAQSWLEQNANCLGLFCDGKFVNPSGRQTYNIRDSSGGCLCSITLAEDEDASRCASSASAGSEAWRELGGRRRARLLLRLAGSIQRYSQCLGELCDLSQCPGSPSALVRLAQYYAGWAQLRDTLLPGWHPRGVVAVVVSDGGSFYSIWQKVLPALALGNAVIVAAGVKTAPPALFLAQIFMEAGLPSGVLNVVTGDASLGARVAQNSQISYLTYSGGRQVGVALAKQTAGLGVPVSLSLAVSTVCPFIVFESADVDSAVDALMDTTFKPSKDCQWVLMVQESVCEGVARKLRLRMARMKCVPLASESHRSLVEAAVKEAEQQGAVLIQSCPPPSSGCVYPPTVLSNVAPSCPSVVSPPPGPVLPMLSFRSASEGVALGNWSPHGQAASIWTEDLTLALETARSLCVGSVWVNSQPVIDPSLPQSGRRESGNCTDGGREGLYQYLCVSPVTSVRRATPSCLDYSRFGAATSEFLVPAGFDPSSVARSGSQLVGGKICKSDSGAVRAVLAPGGAVLAHCPDGGRKDVRNAVESALKVQPGWVKRSPAARALSLYSLADGLEKNKKDLAASISIQTGLPVEEAELEVDLSVSRLSDWAAHCDKQVGQMPVLPQTGSAFSTPEALGVIGVVLPDAMPLLPLVSVLGAAVSMGNAVIIVPSEKFPLPALDFIQVLQAADLPAGLVSVITGGRDHLTHALANHNEIRALWYWGTVEGVQFLQYSCCSPLKRLWLHCENEAEKIGGYWTHPSPCVQEEMWRNAVAWKSVWIPTS